MLLRGEGLRGPRLTKVHQVFPGDYTSPIVFNNQAYGVRRSSLPLPPVPTQGGHDDLIPWSEYAQPTLL
jgi:hypothetical protein